MGEHFHRKHPELGLFNVSNAPNGPGWWEAADGLWYPPELHPNAAAAGAATPAQQAPQQQAPSWEYNPSPSDAPTVIGHPTSPAQAAPGYNAPPPGYNAPPPGYNAPPPGYNAPPPGFAPQPAFGQPPGAYPSGPTPPYSGLAPAGAAQPGAKKRSPLLAIVGVVGVVALLVAAALLIIPRIGGGETALSERTISVGDPTDENFERTDVTAVLEVDDQTFALGTNCDEDEESCGTTIWRREGETWVNEATSEPDVVVWGLERFDGRLLAVGADEEFSPLLAEVDNGRVRPIDLPPFVRNSEGGVDGIASTDGELTLVFRLEGDETTIEVASTSDLENWSRIGSRGIGGRGSVTVWDAVYVGDSLSVIGVEVDDSGRSKFAAWYRDADGWTRARVPDIEQSPGTIDVGIVAEVPGGFLTTARRSSDDASTLRSDLLRSDDGTSWEVADQPVRPPLGLIGVAGNAVYSYDFNEDQLERAPVDLS